MQANTETRSRLAWINRKLTEYSNPNHGTSWCTGYAKVALRAERERLQKELSEKPFEKAITDAIRIAIVSLDRATVGISEDCLWQLTVGHIKNGPSGTNCAYVAREMFNTIVRSKPYHNFVYRD